VGYPNRSVLVTPGWAWLTSQSAPTVSLGHV